MDVNRFGFNKPLAIYNEIDQKGTTDNPFFESAIIPPPKKDAINRVDKYFRYVIDSRDRNTQLYPSPSKYTIELDEDITDVNSVELLVADVPFSRYLVHNKNNVLHFELSGTELEAVVEPGDYTESELATELESKMNTVSGGTSFAVSYTDKTKTFTITNTSPFTLVFRGDSYQHTNNVYDYRYKSNTIAKVLGFRNEDVEAFSSGSGAWGVRSMFPRNFTLDKYIVLKIQNVSLNKAQARSTQSSFTLINNPANPISNYYDHVLKKKLSPPIQSLKKLSISFYDYDGNLYDFQNQDHRLELVFGTLNQTMLYNNVVQNNFM